MPQYPGVAGATAALSYIPPTQALYPGDLPATLFNAEAGAGLVGKASIALALAPPPGLVEQETISISGFFSAAPGVFEIDLQTSDVDADGMYVSETTTITAVNANNAFRALFTIKAKFFRVFVKTLPNAVNLTLTAQA